MSEVEHHKGKLSEIKPIGNEGLEDIASRLLDANNIVYEDYYGSFVECLTDNCEEFVWVGDKIYKHESVEIDPCDDIMIASENDDGTINFEVKYYNGSCGFGEAIEKAVKRMLTPS